jgi:hypothetical protein
MSTQWITDRLPTKQEAISGNVVCCRWGHINLLQWYKIAPGEPWMPIPKPELYSKPKRWRVRWDANGYRWYIASNYDGLFVATLLLDADALATAQRICDIFNEVMP